MITLMTLTAIGTAMYIVFGSIGFLIKVFGRLIGAGLGMIVLMPIVLIFILGVAISYLPILLVMAFALCMVRGKHVASRV